MDLKTKLCNPTKLLMSQIFGLRFFFFANEHKPIHVHVVKGDDNAKIEIEPEIRLVYNHGMKKQDVRRALQLVKCTKMKSLQYGDSITTTKNRRVWRQ